MTTNYNVDRNKNGVNGYLLPFCDQIFSATLAAATDTLIAVPLTAAMGAPTATTNNKFAAVISCDNAADVFIALNGVAAVPAGVGFAATTSELIPRNQLYCKTVKAGDTIHFISPGTPSVTVAFYAIQE